MKLCNSLNQCINISLHWECRKTSFTRCFIVTAKNLIWLVVFFIFLFMVTGREIIFICSTVWLSFMVHICKMIIPSGVFFIFPKFWSCASKSSYMCILLQQTFFFIIITLSNLLRPIKSYIKDITDGFFKKELHLKHLVWVFIINGWNTIDSYT